MERQHQLPACLARESLLRCGAVALQVPASWVNLAYPSLRPLGSWLLNLLQRVTQLAEWTADLGVPKSVWLSGLFNPQSFLTAVMQVGCAAVTCRGPPTMQAGSCRSRSSCFAGAGKGNKAACAAAWKHCAPYLASWMFKAAGHVQAATSPLHIMVACALQLHPGALQTTARRNDWPLDKTVVLTEVTKKQPDQIDAPSRDGAFIHGLTLEGARWDEKAGCLDESRPKELFCPMPVILVRAVTVDKAELKDAYQCPVYTTEARFRQEVFTAQLKSKHSWIKWTLAGVCLFLDVV